tara:strand:- start:199 stop:1044 length:846 start_codon:yes stop_codon:yes gene_type:complete
MRSFEQHLKEFVVYSTSDYVFTLSDHIPISGPMLKRIWPNSIRATVFHATDLKGLHSLIRMEGSKKTISAFFSMMGKYMGTGVATGGGIVAEMEADVLVSARDDIMSKVDKTGRRWVTLDFFASAARNYLGRGRFAMVEKEFSKLKQDLVEKYVDGNYGDFLEAWHEMREHLKYDGRKIAAVIKDYFDGVEKILKRHEDLMGSIMYGYARSKRQTDNSWDEQIVNNFTIKKIHVLEIKGYEDADYVYHDEIKDIGKPVKKWDNEVDLEIYTRQVVKKETGK